MLSISAPSGYTTPDQQSPTENIEVKTNSEGVRAIIKIVDILKHSFRCKLILKEFVQ